MSEWYKNLAEDENKRLLSIGKKYKMKKKNKKKTKQKAKTKKQKQKKSLILLWETIIFKNNVLEKSFYFSQRKD